MRWAKKVRNAVDLAVMSKKLATIITNVPVEFHEEDYRLKEWNREVLNEVFTELEFKTLGKRILGEDFNSFHAAPQGVQTDLFGNAVQAPKATKSVKSAEPVEPVSVRKQNRQG